MVKTVEMTVFGITFEVDVEYEDNAVCGVQEVRCGGMPVKCDLEKFFSESEEILQQVFEEALEDERIAYAEMRYDAAKEEGLLDKPAAND